MAVKGVWYRPHYWLRMYPDVFQFYVRLERASQSAFFWNARGATWR